MRNQKGAVNIIVIGAIILGVLGLIVASTYVGKNPNQNSTSSATPSTTDPALDQQITLDYLTLGQIEEDNIKNSPDLISTTTLDDGSTKYTLKSPLIGRNNIVIIKNKNLLYKRTVTKALSGGKLPNFGTMTASLGAPNQVLKGSRFFGPNYQTYIYALKGTTIIANPDTGEVQEVQLYPKDSSVGEYLSSYGEDIAGYSPKIVSPI